MDLSIDRLDEGVIADQPDLIVPIGAWTDARNIRFLDGAAEKARGYDAALGSLSATAIWATSVTDGTNVFWVYATNSALYATDGTNHANVSHPSLSYAATDDLGWTGGSFHGHVIANDGANVPQVWVPSLANDFTSLSAWPAITASVIRPFGDFLFALRITESGEHNPRLLRWSDRAAPGELPGSWDYTDPTNQAGINELAQTGDALVDCLPLRDKLILYKESHTWLAEYVGGPDVFGFRQLFSEVGMLTENCVIAIGGLHLVLTGDDLVLHDGNAPTSVIDGRMRRWLFNRINSERYRRCFVAGDYRNREAWICFPESGHDWPNMALVFNWRENKLYPAELGRQMTFAVPGIIPGSAFTFNTLASSFDLLAGSFDEATFTPSQVRVLFFDASSQQAFQGDTGETFAGTPMTAYAIRSGLAISRDLKRMKRIHALYPRVTGTAGDELRFWIGTRKTLDSATMWTGPYRFRLGVDYRIPLRVDARVLDLRVEYTGTNTFRLHGLGIEWDGMGYR